MKNFDRSKTLTVLLVILALNVAALFFYWFFMEIQKKTNADIVSLEENLAIELAKDKTADSIEQNLKVNEEKISYLKKLFIEKEGVVDLIEDLEEIGRRNNVSVEITDVNIIPPKKENDYKETLEMKINTGGTWQNVMKYFYELEHMPLVLTFSEINISKETSFDRESENVSTTTQQFPWYGSYTVSILKFR